MRLYRVHVLTLVQDGDETIVYDSMQALLTLEKLHGLFPRIVGKGDYAAVRMQDIVYAATETKYSRSVLPIS